MENAAYIGGNIIDQNYLKYTGWSESNLCVQQYFSPGTVNTISRKVSELTYTVDLSYLLEMNYPTHKE
jgi:hypothetical protein